MASQCTNTLIGMIITCNKRIILLRAQNPALYGLPTNHAKGLDGNEKAIEELVQHMEITITYHRLFRIYDYPNPCDLGGTWHEWRILTARYEGGKLPAYAMPMTLEEIDALALQTKSFAHQCQIRSLEAFEFERFIDFIATNAEWQDSPGLSPIWFLLWQAIRRDLPSIFKRFETNT